MWKKFVDKDWKGRNITGWKYDLSNSIEVYIITGKDLQPKFQVGINIDQEGITLFGEDQGTITTIKKRALQEAQAHLDNIVDYCKRDLNIRIDDFAKEVNELQKNSQKFEIAKNKLARSVG
jgi:hypothetical protein